MEDVISIIVPVYNMEKYLERCMSSILNQTYRHLQIILVDDGSTDASPQMCDAYSKKDARVQVVHKENGGLSDARNAGLQLATGTYIGFVDSDDWIELDMYEKMYAACVSQDADIAVCRYASVYKERIQKTESDRIVVLSREELLEKYIADDADCVIYNSVWSKLFRRELVEGILFPVGHNSEDIMYTTKSFCKVKRAVYLDQCLYNYVQSRGNSIMNSNREERMFQDEIPFWREHVAYIREHVSDVLGAYAEFYFYRRLLSYFTELAKEKETEKIAQRITDVMYAEKKVIRRVYRKACNSYSDKIRMWIFLISPRIYQSYYIIYLKMIQMLKR